MKHANNMRSKVDRADNAEAVAKKAAEAKKGAVQLGKKKDSIEIGKMGENAGAGAVRLERASIAQQDEAAGAKKPETKGKSSWIKGSGESKKIIGNHSVKGKL